MVFIGSINSIMEKNLLYLALAIILLPSCSDTNYLKKCEATFFKTGEEQFAKFRFEEELNMLGHLSEPWETRTYKGKGDFWVDSTRFLKQDSLANSQGKSYSSETEYSNGVLLFQDYGRQELSSMTKEESQEKKINTARYSPNIILQHFLKNENLAKISIATPNIIYALHMGEYLVKLSLNSSTNFIDQISYLSYDELYGDVTTTFHYSDYVSNEQVTYPATIRIEKINGKVVDSVRVVAVEFAASNFSLLDKPADYELQESEAAEQPQITVNKYNDYIHFIDLAHTDDRVMVVEFDDYMLVAEAPINPENGEYIISEVKKIAPSKPIKYFVFGHHHPHYLGGLRAFVHKGATILCTDLSKNYVEYIAKASHTLAPDSLQLVPKNLQTQVVSDSLALGENDEMKIYFIGDKSAHTKDYLIYYFPQDKLLFQDDLCWIPKEGAITKAGPRQSGLYHAIKELNLDVDTVIQSWPVNSHRVKTMFPFSDLEKSVMLEE